jgi:endoglucanase
LNSNDLSDKIKVNQVGYLTQFPKKAIITNNDTKDAKIINSHTNEVVLEKTISSQIFDEITGDRLSEVDFSEITTPGAYYVKIDNLGRSFDFTIADDIYNKPYRTAMRSFYGQRCGMDISLAPDYPEYKYSACHLKNNQFDLSSGKSGEADATGGWHDG